MRSGRELEVLARTEKRRLKSKRGAGAWVKVVEHVLLFHYCCEMELILIEGWKERGEI